MTERTTTPEKTMQAYECAHCGERLDGPDDECSDPLCDTEPRTIGVSRE